MLRLSKLADYGTLVMGHLARSPTKPFTAQTIAKEIHLPQTVVAKILKTLASSGLLMLERGGRGGYRLKKEPRDISVAAIILALDGPNALARPRSKFKKLGALAETDQPIIYDSRLHRLTLADLLRPDLGEAANLTSSIQSPPINGTPSKHH